MTQSPTIKILVGYHKPAVLLKSDILTPIHVGRALATQSSKDGAMSQKDYQWMLDNMLGDDTGDNISNLNRKLCESTAIYWAWKNYQQLGNPDYIGFMHYRRILDFANKSADLPIDNYLAIPFVDYLNEPSKFLKSEDIYKVVRANKYIIGRHHVTNPVRHFKYVNFLNVNDYFTAISLLKKRCPRYSQYADIYNAEYQTYFCNLFILPKTDFFEYAEYLFEILFELNKKIDYTNYSIIQQRMPAYISEWLTGIFFTYLKSKQNILELPQVYVKHTELKPVVKREDENEVSVVMACDDNYAPYLAVTVQSIIENSNEEKHYKVYILCKKLSQMHKCMMSGMQTPNVRIEFIDISGYTYEYSGNMWYTCRHFAEATYFRIFLTEIFKDFKRVVYCDCDAIFLDDVAKLYDIDLEGKMIGAVPDVEIKKQIYLNEGAYYSDILKLNNPRNYFNAGLIIFDIKKCIEFELPVKFIKVLNAIKTPRFVDQDILNVVCEGNTKFLDMVWNVENHMQLEYDGLHNLLPTKTYSAYIQSVANPKFLHYTSTLKPWHDPSSYNANLFWKYARSTPFHEEIIYKNLKVAPVQNITQPNNQTVDIAIIKDIAKYQKNQSRYHRYRLLARLTFGSLRKRYKQKKKFYEDKVWAVRKFLRSNP